MDGQVAADVAWGGDCPAPAPAPAPAQPTIQARPAIWMVKDADTTIYLFGTFHALAARMLLKAIGGLLRKVDFDPAELGLVVMGTGTKWIETLMPPVVTGAVVVSTPQPVALADLVSLPQDHPHLRVGNDSQIPNFRRV